MFRLSSSILVALFCVSMDKVKLAFSDTGICSSCSDCENSKRLLFGLHEELYSPKCEEGWVAQVTKLDTNSEDGPYELLTWNRGAYTDNIPGRKPYIYERASIPKNIYCFKAPDSALPIVGDQREIKVTLNCEHVRCNLQWTAKFGCVDTKVTSTGVQILSDVDDTILCPDPLCTKASDCSVSERKAFYSGVDKRLEHGEIYPGVAELYKGLALGASGVSTDTPAKPMMLSARPKEFEIFLAIDQSSSLNQYFEISGYRQNYKNYGINLDSSMYGTILDGTSHKEFGETKAKHYNTISDSLPKTRFVFFGDNGQGDVCGAQSMFQSTNGARLIAVFIQISQTDPSKLLNKCEDPKTGDFDLNLPASDKVHYFRTHSNATSWALDKKMISCCSAFTVHEAVHEWYQCRCNGNCPRQLPTGVSTKAKRAETLEYCKDVQKDQEELKLKISTTCPQNLNTTCLYNTSAVKLPSASGSNSKSSVNMNGFGFIGYFAITTVSIFILRRCF